MVSDIIERAEAALAQSARWSATRRMVHYSIVAALLAGANAAEKLARQESNLQPPD